jgi:hypothetical protein
MSVRLTWTANPDALSYTVKRATVSGGPYGTLTSGLAALTYDDNTSVNGTTYFYVVAGVNGASASDSAEVQITASGSRDIIPTSNLQMWLNSDENVVSSLGNVSAWGDKSVQGNSGTQANGTLQPALQTDWFDTGFSNIFVGNSTSTDVASSVRIDHPLTLQPPFTIVCYTLNYGMDHPACVLSFNGANLYQALDPQFGAGDTTWGVKTGSILVSSTVTLDTNNHTVVVVARSGSEFDLITNNPASNDKYIIVSKGSGTGFPSEGGRFIGAFSGSHGARNTYAEIIVYDRALGTLEWEQCLAQTTNAHKLY